VSRKIAQAPKPRLRGVSHQWEFVAFAVLGVVLGSSLRRPRTPAAAIYATSVIAIVRRQRALPPAQLDPVAARQWCGASTTR